MGIRRSRLLAVGVVVVLTELSLGGVVHIPTDQT